MITIRQDSGCADTGLFAWDTIWNPTHQAGDWAKAGPGPDEASNRGGLCATAGIATAITLALFTDRRCPPDHPLAHLAGGDLRGWWAHSLARDAGEPDLGSLLWLLERSVCNEDMRRYAETFALEALQPLLGGTLAAKATATAEILPARNGIALHVGLFARDGANVYARQFDILWNQARA